MKNKIKKGLIALFIVGIFGCASACALFAPVQTTPPDSFVAESDFSEDVTSESASETTSKEDEVEDSTSNQPEDPDEEASDDGEMEEEDTTAGEDDEEGNSTPPAEEEDSSSGENDTGDTGESSDGTIELPEDKFH